MRLVLIRPRNSSPYYDPEVQEPLGLEYLAAWRKAAGDYVLVLDSAIEGAGDLKLARRAASFQPETIGFSITTAQEIKSVRSIYAECLQALRGRRVRWVAGGNFVSTDPEAALKLLPPDFVLVRFEGERAMDELAAASPGVEADGRLRTGLAVDNLDTIPFPARPFAAHVLARGAAFNLQGSRGCHGACRYCCSPGMFVAARRWRGRSPAHIAEEMSTLFHRYGACSFNFVDEDFLGANAVAATRARMFAEELGRRQLRVAFSVQVRPGSLSPEAIDCLAGAGLVYVFMGIESDDVEDFRRWHRPWTADPWPLVGLLRERGVEVNAGVLLFHSHSTFAGIRRFATKLREQRLLEYRSATNRLDAAPGSQIHQAALVAGQIDGASPGPKALPYLDPRIGVLHADLLEALAPLGPPSMQAVCELPPALVRRRFADVRRAGVNELLKLAERLDDAVTQSLFALLDLHEKGMGSPGLVGTLRRQNLEIGCEAARDLAAHGFAKSFESLREAIRIDAGV